MLEASKTGLTLTAKGIAMKAIETTTTSRRSFLSRLGLTAAGVALAAPVVAMPETRREAIDRLKIELGEVLSGLYGPGVKIEITDNQISPEKIRNGSIGCVMALITNV